MLKILQARLQQYLNQAGFRKAEEPEIKLPTSSGSWKKQESSRKTSISALLTMPKPLTVWITINWKILKEMGIPGHLTCLLRNLFAGQEATVRTGHGTTALTYSFSYLEPVCCSMSSSNCCFLTCIQVSQEAGQVVWYSHLFKSFPVYCDPHSQRLWA